MSVGMEIPAPVKGRLSGEHSVQREITDIP